MKRPIAPLIAAPLAAAFLLSAGVAQAEVRCAVPMTDWQPRDAVVRLAAQNGWQVQRIKIDDGCYEVKGKDAKGNKFDVKIHPGTLAVLQREHDRDSADHGENHSADDKD